MALITPSRVALSLGVVGLALAVWNQASAPSLDPPLERASVLAGILSVLLMLAGSLWERVLPPPAERVALQGEEGLDLAADLHEPLRTELGWGSAMVLTATPAAVVLVQWRGKVLLRRGLLASRAFRSGPICDQALRRRKAISLVDLTLYPGRDEFDGLLPGLPSVLVQPLGGEGLLLVGGWSARCFGRGDQAWIEGWARRLALLLEPGALSRGQPAALVSSEPAADLSASVEAPGND